MKQILITKPFKFQPKIQGNSEQFILQFYQFQILKLESQINTFNYQDSIKTTLEFYHQFRNSFYIKTIVKILILNNQIEFAAKVFQKFVKNDFLNSSKFSLKDLKLN